MVNSKLSLTWDAHKKNICTGLSSLQQNGEFVDMTLAADGHHVKVHQVIIALASPYLKELIASANCPHPIIFLNKTSHQTLEAILEYIYTGETLVTLDNFYDFVEAGKALHITGLENMQDIDNSLLKQSSPVEQSPSEFQSLDDDITYFEVTAADDKCMEYNEESTILPEIARVESNMDDADSTLYEEAQDQELDAEETGSVDSSGEMETAQIKNRHAADAGSALQYTVSNRGSLQMILNRCVYYLKHVNRDRARQWRCVDYLSACKCPALVVTKDDAILQRMSAHNHPFHDNKILKKVHSGAVYGAIAEAETQGVNKKTNKTASKKDSKDTNENDQ